MKIKTGSKKEETRERILRAAARAIRKHGYEGLGVADVMRCRALARRVLRTSNRATLLAAPRQAGAESIGTARAIAAADENSWRSSYLSFRRACGGSG
jgi:hypothetical protein